MAIVRFYELISARFSDQPLLLVTKLAEKAFEQQQSCQILVRDESEADALDELMWSYSEDAFLPHQIAGQDDDAECPVLILTPDFPLHDREVTINLRPMLLERLGGRLLEIIPNDDAGKAAARERFKHYRGRGETPSFEKV